MGILKQMFRPELIEKFFPREDENTVYFAFARLVGDKDTVCERPFFGDRSKPFEIVLRYVAGCFNFYCDFTIDDIYTWLCHLFVLFCRNDTDCSTTSFSSQLQFADIVGEFTVKSPTMSAITLGMKIT